MNNRLGLISFLIELRKSFPNSKFISALNIFFKLFSLFLLTHDWNLNSEKGISVFLIEFTIIPAINRIPTNIAKSIIILAYISICIIPIVLLIIVYIRIRNNTFNKAKLTTWASLFIYIFYYLLNQHFYMLSVRTYFCKGVLDTTKSYPSIIALGDDCRGVLNYIVITLQSIFIIGFILVNYLIQIVLHDPFFFSNNFILNTIGSNENQWIIYPFSLLILDLEHCVPFYIAAIIKVIARFVFVLFFLITSIIKPTSFYSTVRFFNVNTIILSMCFVSCIIEYCFLYDWNNELIILQSNVNYIVSKLVIEVILAVSLWYYILLKDHGDLCLTMNTIHNDKHNDINAEYALYNKYFYYVLNPFANSNVTERIVCNLEREYDRSKHNKSIDYDQCILGEKYSHEEIIKQSKAYLFNIDFHQASLIDEYEDLMNHFPALYKYLENYIIMKVERMMMNHNKNYIQIIAALFYLAFQKNVNKSFFYLEEFKKSSLYKRSFICKVQIQLINEFILEENQNILKRKSNNFLSFSIEFYQLNKYIYIENQMRKVISSFIDFTYKASELDIDQSHLYDLMLKFNRELRINKVKFHRILAKSKCKLNYLSTKLYLYYQFFYKDIPLEVNDLFKDITKEKSNFLSIEEYSTLIISYSKSKDFLFQIEYASDDFHNSLSYHYGDLNKISLNDILLSDFAIGYSQYLYNEVQTGSSLLVIPNMCFKTKHSECKILFFMGVILFYGNDLHVYAKIAPVDAIPYSKLDAILSDNKRYIDSKHSRLIEKGSCYIIANKSGRIMSISKEFQSFFCLKNRFIQQNKVNLFKDILKDDINSHANGISTKLYVIYENIADIIANQLLDNNRDNYDVDYCQIKEKQKSLTKHQSTVSLLTYLEEDSIKVMGKKDKVFYYVIFKIQRLGNHPISLNDFFKRIISKDTQQKTQTVMQTVTLNGFEAINDMKTIQKPSLINDPNDILNKVTLIKTLSLKILLFYYRFKRSILYKQDEHHHLYNELLSHKEIDLPETQTDDPISQSEINRERSSNFFDYIHKRKGNESIYTNLFIWSISLIIFFIFNISLGIIKEYLYENGLELVFCNLYITVTKKVMISVAASVYYIQIVSNKLQPLVFENGLTNTKDFHGGLLIGRINDFSNNLYLFQQHFSSFKINSKNYESLMNHVLYDNFNTTRLSIYLLNKQSQNNLNDVLGYFHQRIGQGFYDELYALIYNQTSIVNSVEYYNYTSDAFKGYDYLYYDRDFLMAERIAVYLIENSFTEFKYRLDEFVNIFEVISFDLYTQDKLLLMYLNLIDTILIICVIISQVIFYFKTNKELFVNYFIAYMHIQYFNRFTIEKAMILQNVMSITIEKSYNEFNSTNVNIQNCRDENNILKIANKVIEEDLPLDIHSFNPITIVNSNSNSNESADHLFITPNSEILNQVIDIGKVMTLTTNTISTVNDKSNAKFNLKRYKEHNDKSNKGKSKSPLSSLPENAKLPNREFDSNNINTINNQNNSNNNTTNSINQTTSDTLVRPEEHLKRTKKILKPSSNHIAILITFLLLITIIVFFIVYLLLTNSFFSTLYTYLKYQSLTLQRITTFHELLLIFQITILKNKEIVFDYQPFGYLNSTPSLAYLNSITTHHVFNETMAKMLQLEEEYEKAINVVLDNPYQKTLKLYENIFNSDSFCINNTMFLKEYKQYLILPIFTSISNVSNDYLIDACGRVGEGFNLKGFKTAMMSLLNSIGNSHNDFIAKANRDPKYNLDMLNLDTVRAYQMESHRIIDSIFMNYQVSTSKDYEDRYATLSNYEWMFNVVLSVYIALIILAYFVYVSLKFNYEYMVINEIEAVLFSSVMF